MLVLLKRFQDSRQHLESYGSRHGEQVVKNNGNAYRWITLGGPPFKWEDLDNSNPKALFSDEFEVAVFGEARADTLGIPGGESKFWGRVEGIRLCDIDASEKFSDSESLSDTSIGVGESVEDIWSERFQRLATFSREVSIVDRYAARENNFRGIRRLLDFLDQDARSCCVTIYSSPNRGRSAKYFERQMRAAATELSGNGIEAICVSLFRDSDFRNYSHDRHVRFDSNVISVGVGTSVFNSPRVRNATDVGLVTLKPGIRERKELDLENFGTVVHKFRVPVAQRSKDVI